MCNSRSIIYSTVDGCQLYTCCNELKLFAEPELSHEKAYENANNAFLLHQSKLKMYQNAEEIFKSKGGRYVVQ